MDHKQPILHELLQQHQEPFHLKTYISAKRSHSQLSNSSPAESFAHRGGLRNAPCAPAGGGFLHVPASTAAALAEAATRIQKQRQTQIKSVGVSLFGSFLKILKHRSGRSRVERNCDSGERENPEDIRISRSCSRLCRDCHFRASASTSFHDFEARFGSSPISPFRFSPLKSPTSFSGRRTPDLGSPATSPIRRVKQEEAVVEEEKEQCSPVCVLDAPYEDDEHQSLVGDEENDHDHDLERGYANIERSYPDMLFNTPSPTIRWKTYLCTGARQQLLERLERFEKLAALDQVDLEQKLLEASDEEYEILEGVELEQLPVCRKQWLETSSSLKHSRMMKREEKCKIVMGHLWRDAIDMMMQVEVEVEETAAELELAIFDELMEQCFCMDPQLNVYVTT